MFKAKVKLHGKTRAVQWESGALTGDEIVLASVRAWIKANKGESVGFPGGPSFASDYLSTANGAVAVLYAVCDEVSEFDGEIEPWAALPKGAIA